MYPGARAEVDTRYGLQRRAARGARARDISPRVRNRQSLQGIIITAMHYHLHKRRAHAGVTTRHTYERTKRPRVQLLSSLCRQRANKTRRRLQSRPCAAGVALLGDEAKISVGLLRLLDVHATVRARGTEEDLGDDRVDRHTLRLGWDFYLRWLRRRRWQRRRRRRHRRHGGSLRAKACTWARARDGGGGGRRRRATGAPYDRGPRVHKGGGRRRSAGGRAPSLHQASTGGRAPSEHASARGAKLEACGAQAPRKREPSRLADFRGLRRHRPPLSSPPARPYPAHPRHLPLEELRPRAPAMRHGYRGRKGRSRLVPRGRPLLRSSEHRLPPTRVAGLRSSCASGARSPLASRTAARMFCARAHGASEVPGSSRVASWGHPCCGSVLRAAWGRSVDCFHLVRPLSEGPTPVDRTAPKVHIKYVRTALFSNLAASSAYRPR